LDIIVADDFLEYKQFKQLQEFVMSYDISWFFQPVVNTHESNELSCYFTHSLYNPNKPYVYSEHYHKFLVFWEALEIKSLMRMKLNLYPRVQEIEKHDLHRDYPFTHKGCVFSFNTCDGGTRFEDGTIIDSVENRAILFDAYELHGSLNTTNAKGRFNLNINYF